MEFPSIKLNIFKKLEYFLEMGELNQKFDSQFKILINRKWDNERKKFEGTYPSWEIEKKIIFWTYASHKHLGRPIKEDHFKDMFISDNEYKKIGAEKIFENLELNGFGTKEVKKNKKNEPSKVLFFINSKGLTYGELLWYLYKPKEYKFKDSIHPKKYTDVFRTPYKLTRQSFGVYILHLQLFSLYLFMIMAGLFFTLEFLDQIDLFNNMENIIINNFYHPKILLILFLLPIFLFSLSIFLNIFYRFFVVNNRYKSIERIRII